MPLVSVSPASARAVPRFAALHVAGYRRYFLLGLLAMTAKPANAGERNFWKMTQ